MPGLFCTCRLCGPQNKNFRSQGAKATFPFPFYRTRTLFLWVECPIFDDGKSRDMRMVLVFILLLLGFFLAGQSTKKPAAVRPAAPSLVSSVDSLSYALGFSIANFYKQQGIESVNTSIVTRAINDVMKTGKPVLNEQQCNTVIMGYVQKVKEMKSSANRKAGESFLAENKSKTGVVSLPSGLEYLVLKEGTGPKPLPSDKVRCHYQGTLLDGTIFDSSIQRGQSIEFNVKGVIPGWTEALQLMAVGSKWRLFIPAELGYGDQQAGQIPPGSTLIFDVELIDIVK
jgi:FKBP-type peptidyl-prolyl cis-trans isomerase FklB